MTSPNPSTTTITITPDQDGFVWKVRAPGFEATGFSCCRVHAWADARAAVRGDG